MICSICLNFAVFYALSCPAPHSPLVPSAGGLVVLGSYVLVCFLQKICVFCSRIERSVSVLGSTPTSYLHHPFSSLLTRLATTLLTHQPPPSLRHSNRGSWGRCRHIRKDRGVLFCTVFHLEGELLPELVQNAFCIVEMRVVKLIYITIRYETFPCILQKLKDAVGA